MISQPHSAAEFRLPAACVDLADDLGGQFGFASYLLLPCFPIAIGLAAHGCRLETGIWPEPINAALDVGFGVDNNEEGIVLAISHILAPVLKTLGANTKLGAGPSSKKGGPAEQETLVIGNAVREPAVEKQNTPPFQDSQTRRPAFVMENLKPAQLMRMTKKLPGCFVLAFYDDAHFIRLISKARLRAVKDLSLLLSGWGKLPELPHVPDTEEPRVQADVGCLVVCHQPTLGRFVASHKNLVNQLTEQFILLAAETSGSIQWQVDWARRTKRLCAWRELVENVASACTSAENLTIGMSSEASKLLMEYLRVATRPNGTSWGQLGPLVAAKLALCFHLCLWSPESRVSAQVMEDAIGMARWLVRTSAQVKALLSKEQSELNLRRHAERLLARIPERGPIGWRALRRHFNPQAITIHEPALDYLVGTGQIVRNSDDSIQRASA